jgi:hypothetical protein
MIRRPTQTATKINALAVAVLLGGCARTSLDCSEGPRPKCDPTTFGACAPGIAPCRYIPPGATNTLVEIDSSPTPARIYVDGTYVGRTPLERYLWFSSTTSAVTVVAKPLYPGQARQERRLSVPPLPTRLTFFMNNPPTEESTEEPVKTP